MLVPAAGGRIILSMAPTLKKVLLAALSLFVVLATAAGLQLWREAKRPKRAWVAYSESARGLAKRRNGQPERARCSRNGGSVG